MKERYKIIYQGGEGEIVEKKSRFIAEIRPVESEEKATAFIAEVKKKYWDARHHCSAFTIGENNEVARCSDDGEPAQTAGRPMLDVLLGRELHNVCAVVTRYFGGTLLGTGGLVRAYQKATQSGLESSIIIEKQRGILGSIVTDYNGIGKIQYILAQNNIPIADSIYGENVSIQVVVPAQQQEKIEKELIEGTNGKAEIDWEKEVIFAIVEKDLKIF